MRIRIDFGRIVPGVLLFILAIVLLVALAAVALLSFLFSFEPLWAAVMSAALQLTLVPAVLIVVSLVVILTGVSWWGGGGWFSGVARARARKDRLRLSERVGEIVGVVITLIIFAFFYENQLRGVAFFGQPFGSWEQLFFYGPLFTGAVLSVARAVYGRRNGIRPLDSLNMAFLAVSAFWLFTVFPFDFTHVGDLFPTAIQFLFAWVSNDIGRFLFFLAGMAASASFVYDLVLYAAVRGQLLAMGAGATPRTIL